MRSQKFIQADGERMIGSSLMSLNVAGLSARADAQNEPLTALQIVERIRKNLGAAWKDSELDVFCAGDPGTHVTGIATSFAPSLDVLRRAASGKKNMIIVREHLFYRHNNMPSFMPVEDLIAKDPACNAKRAFIEKNNLVIWRFTDNVQSRSVDGQLSGLARALKWEGYRQSGDKSRGQSFRKEDSFFVLPETTLKDLALSIGETLHSKGMRMIGDPAASVRKVALSPGLIKVPVLEKLLQEPAVDAVVTGEPIEWEASPYFQDVIASGQKKGMIIIGLAASEDPGSGEIARWLGTIVPEVSVEWIPIGDPFWMLKPLKQA